MKILIKHFSIIGAGILAAILSISCLDQKYEDLRAEENQKIKIFLSENGYTEDNNLGNGIYLKKEDSDNSIPVVGNTILVEYTGKYTNDVVFETTDSLIADSQGLANKEFFVYGPRRHKVGTMMYGFDMAILHVPVGTEAQMVIPSYYAFGNYNPVVYDVKLLEIIMNDSTYEEDIFKEFVEVNEFDDSVYIALGLLYKGIGDITDSVLREDLVIELNDTVKIKLIARYAENYYNGKTGRQFYPLGIDPDVFEYYWGTTTNYPNRPAIDSAVKYMKVGQTLEIAFKSGADAPAGYRWGYGAGGLIDNNLNYAIIAPYTPLHYRIELISSSREK